MFKLMTLRILASMSVALLLAACETSGFFGAGSLGGNSSMFQSLGRTDKGMARNAILKALDAPGNKAVRWRNPLTGNEGAVKPGSALVAGLSDDGLMYAAPAGIATTVPLETALGVYQLNRNSNIRLGPSTSERRLNTLGKGTKVTALGRHNSSNWYLIGQGEKVLGYIYGDLISQTGSSDAMLMGGPTVKPNYCRSYSHTITLRGGRSDTVGETVCRRSSGSWAPLR